MKKLPKTIKPSDNYIYLLIRGAGNLGKMELAEDFFHMLHEIGSECIPTRLGICEPMKIQYSIENAKKLWLESEKKGKWGGGIIFKGASGLLGSVNWNDVDNSNDLSFRIASNVMLSGKKIDKFVTFTKKLFVWSNGFYGHAYHGSKPIFSSGLDYKTCLPGISWLNLFGKPYVNMFGADVIESAPCYVEKFAESSYILLTSKEPRTVTPDLLYRHELVKDHLGKEAFDRKDTPRQSVYTWEDIRTGKHLPSTEGYRSPDLSEYLKDPKKNEELFVVVNDDSTLTSFKRKARKKPLKKK
jgi:hypothetical protein